MKSKIEALAKFLECETDEIDQSSRDENAFSCGRAEYLVLTDEEADEMAAEYIKQSLWAFNAEFIASHAKNGLNNAAIESLRKAQGELCESANDLVEALIDDLDHFIADAIAADGRGHFLAGYDGEENKSGEFFIYRTN